MGGSAALYRSLAVATALAAALSGALAFGTAAVADPVNDPGTDPAAEIEARLRGWTEDFNAGRVERVCDLFAPDLRSHYGDYPQNDFDSLCKGLHEALGNATRSFVYELDLGEVMVSGDMAAVRMVWHLTVTDKATGEAVRTSDRGLDVFRLQPDGEWRIARFLAYPLGGE